ncbi:xylulokinase [Microbacterium trichothecenolyticum]|uniref:Xylulokinase n=1 Tax=Microbacterium trichothecenolyticum TaxID=69370 RepID=A0ABU0TUY8_MICTR|nr:FGGY family carbohydrate kinase [Microbacterium trichothecenolyticum]MDQ1123475.1 xylulokinase [Microbacterium trichothecenolyticum]
MSVHAAGGLAVGLDLGTSGMKAVAIDDTGAVVARAYATYPTSRPEPFAAEQHTSDWICARDVVLDGLARATDARRWRGIALSAMLPTLVELDDSLGVIQPAVTWQDGRADNDAKHLVAAVGAHVLARRTGQRVDGHYLLPMHMRRRARDVAEVSMLVGAKDLLFHTLTGEVLTDPSTATGYGAFNPQTGDWDDTVLAAAGVDRHRVPTIAPSLTMRSLREDLARRWGCPKLTPVVLGAADSVLGAAGLGVGGSGTGVSRSVAYIAGTSTVILADAPDASADPEGRYLVTPLAEGGWGREMDLMATGSAFTWWAQLLAAGDGPSDLLEIAGDADLLRTPVFAPYVSPGEQGALWDPALTGILTGLSLRTTRAQLAGALAAGIVVESLRCLEVLASASDDPHTPVAVTGRSASSSVFLQALADASGRSVHINPGEHDHSALGAALLVWSHLGRPVRATHSPASSQFTPRAGRREAWLARLAEHDRLHDAARAG